MPEQVIELNIALVPEPELGARQAKLSQSLAGQHKALVQLGDPGARLTLAPHLTLYQVPIPIARLADLDARLAAVCQDVPVQALEGTGFAYNSGEGSIEVSYGASDALVALQGHVIAALNPLRGDLLLERDPAGNRLDDLRGMQGQAAERIRRAGYAEIDDPRAGGAFRPHVTLNWFEPGTDITAASKSLLPGNRDMDGDFTSLGVFVLGPYGTCPQLLMAYDLLPR